MKRHPLSDQLRDITRDVVGTYRGDRTPAHHLDPHRALPSRTETIRALDMLFAVFYPGFFGVQHLTRENVEYHVGALLDDVAAILYEQVRLAYQLSPKAGVSPQSPEFAGHCEDWARAAVESFFGRVTELRRLLVLDVQAAMDGDPAAKSFAEIVFAYPGLEAVTIHRIAHELYVLGVPLLPRIMSEHAHSKTGIDIHPGATIGESFFIDHGTGVVIGETSHIGRGVKIYQGVTLGALSFPKDEGGNLIRTTKRHPTICDNVVIYSGATILGGKTVIGEGAVVGGNTWVIESAAPGERILNDARTSRAKQKQIFDAAYGHGEGI